MDQIDIGESLDALHDWRVLGFNLDGLETNPNLYKTVCQTAGWENQSLVPNFDGPAGQDNSFGKDYVPVLRHWPPGTSAFNEGLAKGKHTMMLDFVGLTAASDQPSLVTRFYRGAPAWSTPKFDGSDCWPVNRDSLNDPADVKSSTTVFEQSSIVANKWTSGAPTTLKVTLPSALGSTVTLTIHHAIMTLDLAADHHSGVNGMLGGVLDPSELNTALRRAAALPADSCWLMAEFQIVVDTGGDIMIDGTQDPMQTCNGISIGFAFTMKEVRRGPVAPADPIENGYCQ
jgi:hypothetical protein